MTRRPLVIWEEYRLHAIVFCLRLTSSSLFGALWPMQNNDWDHVALFCIVMAHHLVVDEITRRLGPGDPNQTTVRGHTDEKTGKSSNNHTAPKAVTLGYAFFQHCALGSTLLPTSRLMDLGYNSLVAVQSSAFLMTLFRKGLIRWYTHAAWYSIALVLAWMVMYNTLPLYFWAKIAICFNLRVNYRMDKYKIWTIYAICSLPSVTNFVCREFDAYRSTMQTPDFSYFAQPASI